MAKADKQRLDALLVAKGLCESRALAQRLIRAGEVKVNQQLVDKPGTPVTMDAVVELAQRPPYVSRGGEKLAKALTEFAIDVDGRICLDGGISTGGFTDCLLQNGATKVYGVDVGYGQVAWKLRQDERVILRERANFRYLTPQDLYGNKPWPNLGVMDLSFISLTKVMAPLWSLLAPPREVVLLVKPQFEVGREKIGKKGVVRDAQAQAEAIDQVWRSGQSLGWQFNGLTFSPITGPAGNVEYLLWLSQTAVNTSAPTLAQLGEMTQKTLDSFKT
ncbi:MULTISPECIES: TlyA family RNA methyltransferase [Synechocystis]|uniref:TlyA family RNA methyltransferase n=1 Tax=Synechocystis salina LEGE 00031 TaxID=1828736 RepID=A0ABR9VMI1_9SYNC|nr:MULTISPECIES: TlyA family RNA methyltransferase [Synechocystis]MBD2653853.1 TlyA family RNA methyltransferase [Synechocystis sp. FACHB-383]MBE9240024.1 TlyA family RNA methyltransferase [Synechocystis salina LEGE 00041]MBE9252556.1 TlyA family RNA methyltransferase [Synechocystis salina LEGE 00031]